MSNLVDSLNESSSVDHLERSRTLRFKTKGVKNRD